MCVLASVRNFSVLCFERVRRNSVCGALSVRSGLDHLQIGAEIDDVPKILRRVVAPGRNSAVLCFEYVTSHSTFWAEPGRNVLGDANPGEFLGFSEARF